MWRLPHELRLPLASAVTIARQCWTAFGIIFWISIFSRYSVSVNAQNVRTNVQNVTIPLSSERMVFSPFLCDNAERVLRPDECAGAWFATDVPGSPSSAVMTFGRNSTDPTDVIPQMFFQFRASMVYLTFLPAMNASINVTLSANDITITRTLDSSSNLATIVNLPQDETTTLAITVLPSSEHVQFGLQSLVMTVPLGAASSSILPTPSLPPPSPVSTWFSPSSTSFAISTITMPAIEEEELTNKNMLIRYAVGITLGVGLGVPLVLALGFFWWKRRRKAQSSVPDSFLPEMEDHRR